MAEFEAYPEEGENEELSQLHEAHEKVQSDIVFEMLGNRALCDEGIEAIESLLQEGENPRIVHFYD